MIFVFFAESKRQKEQISASVAVIAAVMAEINPFRFCRITEFCQMGVHQLFSGCRVNDADAWLNVGIEALRGINQAIVTAGTLYI